MTPPATDYRYGPVEFYLVELTGDRPDPGTIDALNRLTGTGLVRLLDLVLISRTDDGTVTTVELEDEAESIGLGPLAAAGIAGQEDIDDLGSLVEPGTTAVLAVLELAYQRELASSVAHHGGTLLAYERIPAPVVNALMDAEAELEGSAH